MIKCSYRQSLETRQAVMGIEFSQFKWKYGLGSGQQTKSTSLPHMLLMNPFLTRPPVKMVRGTKTKPNIREVYQFQGLSTRTLNGRHVLTMRTSSATGDHVLKFQPTPIHSTFSLNCPEDCKLDVRYQAGQTQRLKLQKRRSGMEISKMTTSFTITVAINQMIWSSPG